MSVAGANLSRLDIVLGRLRRIAREAPRFRDEINEIVAELVRLGLDDSPPPDPVRQPERSRLNLVEGNQRRHATKEHDGQRRCPRHDDGRGAWLPVSAFAVKNQATGSRRAWCAECTRAYQRERYVSVADRALIVELLEGDRCIGHDCPVCGLPFEIGDRVRGTDLVHDDCAGGGRQAPPPRERGG